MSTVGKPPNTPGEGTGWSGFIGNIANAVLDALGLTGVTGILQDPISVDGVSDLNLSGNEKKNELKGIRDSLAEQLDALSDFSVHPMLSDSPVAARCQTVTYEANEASTDKLTEQIICGR